MSDQRMAPTAFLTRRANRKGLWENGKPKKWYYAIPIVAFWIIIIGFILKMVL